MSRIDTSQITKFLLFSLRAAGLWPAADYFNIFYRIYGLAFLTIFLYGFTVFIVINVFKLDNKDELFDAMFMCFINLAMTIKTITFMVKYQTLRDILKIIQNFRLSDDDVAEHRFVAEKMKYFLKILLIYYGSCNVALFGIDAGALVASQPELMWKAWYPLDWQHNRLHYWMVFAYQSIGMRIEVNLNITLDLFPTFLLCMMAAMLDILGRRLERIGNECDLFSGERGVCRGEVDKQRFDALVDAVRLHQEIFE